MCYKQKCRVVSLNLAHPVHCSSAAAVNVGPRPSYTATRDPKYFLSLSVPYSVIRKMAGCALQTVEVYAVEVYARWFWFLVSSFLIFLFWLHVVDYTLAYTCRLLFYLRDAMLARVIGIATRLSVRLSVRPSVTRRYCVKTKKASVMISSPSGSPMILVFWRQISSQNSKGFPRTGASKKGGLRTFSDFLALSVNNSKTVEDRAKVTIND